MTDVKAATSNAEISKCFAVMSELRPLLIESEFVDLVRHMASAGYQLAYVENDSAVVAVAGYRIQTSLFMGKNLYIDDLVTSEECRSEGQGKILIDWLRDKAKNHDCRYLHLDSGTQRHRAHRFYLQQGMDIASFHFSQKLDSI